MKDITLVDLNDNPIAGCEKMEAHEKALLHRAFSVFIYHDGKMLIQKERLINIIVHHFGQMPAVLIHHGEKI